MADREPKQPRRLVIDASVGRAAGGPEAVFPTSKRCRDFLEAVLKICHQIAFDERLEGEWEKDACCSRFARKWTLEMERRGKICRIGHQADPDLRRKITRHAASEKHKENIEKDIPLIESARATDRLVVSLDHERRQWFCGITSSVTELRSVTWINPDRSAEEAISWLREGAPNDRRFELGKP